MGDVVPFPEMPKRESRKEGSEKRNEEIMHRISPDAQQFIVSLLKSEHDLDPRELMKQKEFVREMTDEEVIQHVENKENQEMLKDNLSFLRALYERIVGA